MAGIPRPTINRWESGTKAPDASMLAKLATTLDATMDYFHGLGEHYEDDDNGYAKAAIEMSFARFTRDLKFSVDEKERCRRVLGHEKAPRTLAGWRELAEMIELAIGPPDPKLTNLELVKGRKR